MNIFFALKGSKLFIIFHNVLAYDFNLKAFANFKMIIDSLYARNLVVRTHILTKLKSTCI